MLDTASYEEKQLFYRMLKHTPIVIIPKDDKEKSKEILDKYEINPNKHIKELDIDEGEYGSRKDFVDLFGTRIMVPHLIHELGHAWVAEKDQYEIDENGILTQRVGTAELKYELKKQEDGTYTKKRISQNGLMLEEGLNTNMEDEAMMRFLDIDVEKLNELYKGILIPSNYRGLVSNVTNYLQEQNSKMLLRDWRVLGNKSSKEKFNSVVEQTESYQKRTEPNENMKSKIELFENPESARLEELFNRRKSEFFPDKTNMSGIEMLDNGILQFYNIKVNQIGFMGRRDGVEYYRDILGAISGELYPLINQTGEKYKELDEKSLAN